MEKAAASHVSGIGPTLKLRLDAAIKFKYNHRALVSHAVVSCVAPFSLWRNDLCDGQTWPLLLQGYNVAWSDADISFTTNVFSVISRWWDFEATWMDGDDTPQGLVDKTVGYEMKVI